MAETDIFTVYSYGGGEAVYHIFNSVAMLFKNGFVKGTMEIGLALGIMWTGLKSGIERDHYKQYVRLFMTYIFVAVALIPSGGGMTMHVRDVITKSGKSIDNLPPGLVIPASLISGLGFAVTKSFESVFQEKGDGNYLPYHRYGTMFGAQVMSELENFRIQDPVFRENIESYISNCIMYDVMIGQQYDITDLKNSNDIIGLISEHASNIRMFNYRTHNATTGSVRELKTCKAGIANLTSSLVSEPDLLSKRFASLSNSVGQHNLKNDQNQSDTKPKDQALGKNIIEALRLSMKFYNNETTAASQLNQVLLINAFKHKPSSYSTVRAAQTQNITWRVTGEMAKQTLPIMHALFQAIIYGVFPIVMCLIYFPGGFKALGSYFGMMAWIELWAPLFAVLNLIVSVFAKSSGVESFTIQNLDQIVSSQSNYALAASSLGMLVPVLSYMIIKGGAGQFVHIASQLNAATMAGISMATQEEVTGNKSLDNISMGNRSFNNVSANKYDTSGYINNIGQTKQMLEDGTSRALNQDGSVVYSGGGGNKISVLATNIRTSDSITGAFQESVSEEQSAIKARNKEISDAESIVQRNTAEFLAKAGKGKASGTNYSTGESTNSSKTISKTIDFTEQLQKRYGLSSQQASSVTAGFMISAKVPLLGDILGIGGGGEFGVRYTTQTQQNQALEDMTTFAKKEGITETIDVFTKATKDINFSETQSEDQTLIQGMHASHDKIESLRNANSISEQNIKRYNEAISITTSNSASIDRDGTQNFLEFYAQRKVNGFNIGMEAARKSINAWDNTAQNYYKDFTKVQQDSLLNKAQVSINSDKTLIGSIYDNTDFGTIDPTSGLGAVTRKAKEAGIVENQVVQNENLKGTVDQKLTDANNIINEKGAKINQDMEQQQKIINDKMKYKD